MRRHLARTAGTCAVTICLFAMASLALAQSPVVPATATPQAAVAARPNLAPQTTASTTFTPILPLEPPAPPEPKQAEAPAAPPAPPAPPQATPKPAAVPRTPKAPEPMPAPIAPQLPGRESIESDPVNVRIEVTISYQAGSVAAIKRSAILTVANGTGLSGTRASLRAGSNVPVPTTTFTPIGTPEGKEPTPAKPMTSFSYRSVGLNVDVRHAAVLAKNTVRTQLDVEFSTVDDRTSSATGAPSFPAFSQSMSLYLESGKPLVVAQSSDFVDNVERKQTVEVKATILR